MTEPLAILAAFALGSIFGALAHAFVARPKPEPPTPMQRAFCDSLSAKTRMERMQNTPSSWQFAHRTDSDA